MFLSGHVTPERRIHQAHYVARKLRRRGHDDDAAAILAVATTVRSAERHLEDLLVAVFALIADRDAADDTLDEGTQTLRLGLASRGLDATATAPYTQLFHKGVRWYIAAPLADEEARYLELKARIERYLPADDPLRGAAITAIDQGLAAWQAATKALADARREAALARADLETALDALDTLLERVYGTLIAAHGRRNARRFFPRYERSEARSTDDEDEGPPTEEA